MSTETDVALGGRTAKRAWRHMCAVPPLDSLQVPYSGSSVCGVSRVSQQWNLSEGLVCLHHRFSAELLLCVRVCSVFSVCMLLTSWLPDVVCGNSTALVWKGDQFGAWLPDDVSSQLLST